MEKNNSASRRKFLTKQLPAGAMMCLGCQSLLASPLMNALNQDSKQKAKSMLDSGMSAEDVFRFAIGTYVPIIQNMEKSLGKKKLLSMAKNASADNMKQFIEANFKDVQPRDMKTFSDFIIKYLATPPFDKGLTHEVVVNTDKVFETKYTECIIAKIYKEMNAADLGFAIECSPGEAIAKAFNPKMKATHPKIIMKGDDVCIERFELTT